MENIVLLLTDLAHARAQYYLRGPHHPRFFDNELLYLDIIRTILLRDRQTQTAEALRALLLLPTVNNPNSTFWNDVPVAPTEEQFIAAIAPIDPVNENCSVCMASMNNATGVPCRLRHCGHRFHRSCLSQWFRHSSRCPVCRNDIREVPNNQSNENAQNSSSDSDEE